MGSCVLLDVKSGAFGGGLSQAFALEGQPVSVVHEPVEDGVGDSRVGDGLMPLLDWNLAGHDRRAAPVPIVNDLQEVTPLIRRQIGKTPVVEDQQFDTGYGLEQARMPAVA